MKKNYLKIIALSAFTALSCFALSGCGGSDNQKLTPLTSADVKVINLETTGFRFTSEKSGATTKYYAMFEGFTLSVSKSMQAYVYVSFTVIKDDVPVVSWTDASSKPISVNQGEFVSNRKHEVSYKMYQQYANKYNGFNFKFEVSGWIVS